MWWRPGSVTTRSCVRKSLTAVIRIALKTYRRSSTRPGEGGRTRAASRQAGCTATQGGGALARISRPLGSIGGARRPRREVYAAGKRAAGGSPTHGSAYQTCPTANESGWEVDLVPQAIRRRRPTRASLPHRRLRSPRPTRPLHDSRRGRRPLLPGRREAQPGRLGTASTWPTDAPSPSAKTRPTSRQRRGAGRRRTCCRETALHILFATTTVEPCSQTAQQFLLLEASEKQRVGSLFLAPSWPPCPSCWPLYSRAHGDERRLLSPGLP